MNTRLRAGLALLAFAAAAGVAAAPMSQRAARIAFHADPGGSDDLFTARPDGSSRRRLTAGLQEVATPFWSPDGKTIAFLARRTGAQEVYVVPAAGGTPRQLTHTGIDHYNLGWSPDGASLIFACCGEHRTAVQTLGLRGGLVHTLARNAAQPHWSMANGRILYLSFHDSNPELYSMNAKGGDQRRLTRNPAEDSSPAWSPDGMRIAFASKRTGRSQIWVMNADGGKPRRLVRDRWYDDEPAWSPDVRRIVFTSYRNRDPLLRGIGNAEIVVASADGRQVTNLTHTAREWEGDPAWSPAGDSIAFAFRRDPGPTGTFQLAVMRADGSRRRSLPGVAGGGGMLANSCCPAWRP